MRIAGRALSAAGNVGLNVLVLLLAGAGGAVVVVLDTDTRAFAGRDPLLGPVAGNVILSSYGSTHIAADSTTVIDAAAGSAGVTLDGTGFGASVAVVIVSPFDSGRHTELNSPSAKSDGGRSGSNPSWYCHPRQSALYSSIMSSTAR